MSAKKDTISTKDYQVIRIEAWLAAFAFTAYALYYGSIYINLGAKGALSYRSQAIGMTILFALGWRCLIPPLHRKGYLDLDQPKLKQIVPKGGRPSLDFVLKQLLCYGLALVLISSLANQALKEHEAKTDLSNLPAIQPFPIETPVDKAIKDMETPPSLSIPSTEESESD